ncbi:hypothetical protein B808_106 [Fructilactobacillus florum 8D]|uniref:Uncharacterized protein n=1 Tax=Fructilactobacillus florum 8D TaxID=1221538 RepID=W9EI78_9LACO|nr:hypothetical protein [Fructilactobacillus florum]EKK20741.1 hypothetical protein B807_418 [Fructilactobacillus florum 2F]ETO40951.1 hypothetical protein B808_106 [Fructilactobacillus florum 8D]
MKYIKQENYSYKANDSSATKEDTLSLLDQVTEQKELLQNIKEEFPLNENLNIDGTEPAINLFNEIDNKKYDYDLSLNDLESLDFKRVDSGSNNFELRFSVVSEKDHKLLIRDVETIYDAKKKLLDLLLEINKFSNFMLRNDKRNELVAELEKLSKDEDINNKIFNFRFISSEGKEFLRSVVTKNRYKTYDNPIIFYISLIIIHNLSKDTNQKFYLDRMQISDSKLNASFLEKSGSEIGDGIKVKTGLLISNSELGDGAAKFNAEYEVENTEGKKVTVIKDTLATINHGNNPNTIKDNLKKSKKLKENQKETISAVKKIKWNNDIKQKDVLKLMASISHVKNAPQNLKEAMKKSIYQIDLTKQAYNVLEIFDKLDGFLKDEDPDIALILESKFDQWLTKLEL